MSGAAIILLMCGRSVLSTKSVRDPFRGLRAGHHNRINYCSCQGKRIKNRRMVAGGKAAMREDKSLARYFVDPGLVQTVLGQTGAHPSPSIELPTPASANTTAHSSARHRCTFSGGLGGHRSLTFARLRSWYSFNRPSPTIRSHPLFHAQRRFLATCPSCLWPSEFCLRPVYAVAQIRSLASNRGLA